MAENVEDVKEKKTNFKIIKRRAGDKGEYVECDKKEESKDNRGKI